MLWVWPKVDCPFGINSAGAVQERFGVWPIHIYMLDTEHMRLLCFAIKRTLEVDGFFIARKHQQQHNTNSMEYAL